MNTPPHLHAPHNSTSQGRMRPWLWLIIVMIFVGFLYLVRSILLPFVVGMLAAYFLDPAVRKLRARGWSRSRSAATITIGFFLLAIGLCILLVPPVVHQSIDLVKELPADLQRLQTKYTARFQTILSRLGADQVDSLKESIGTYSGTFVTWLVHVATGALQSGLALLDIFSLIFITPIVAFYLLRDWHMVVSRFYALLPRDQSHTIRDQLSEVDRTLSGFIRGQTNLCLIMACFYGVLLPLVGLNFGLLIGVMTGLMLFIPFVGFAICFVLSTVIAVFQFSDGAHILAVLAIYGVGIVIENSFLTPKLVGSKVGLHPLWIMFGMLAGAALFGFIGILIAVPLTAVLGVLVRFAISRYLHSSLYTGEPAALPETPVPAAVAPAHPPG